MFFRVNGFWWRRRDVGFRWMCFVLALLQLVATSGWALIIPTGLSSLKSLDLAQNNEIESICGQSTESHQSLSGGRRYPWAVSIMHQGQNKLGGAIISPHHILTAAHGFVGVYFPTGAGWTPLQGERCQFTGIRRFGSRRIAYGDDCIRLATGAESITRDPRHRNFRNRRGESFVEDEGVEWNNCSRTNVQFNRIRAVYVDDGFAAGGCLDGHDWAIVEVEQPMRFSATVRPICLPAESRFDEDRLRLDDPRLMVVGWGKPTAFDIGHPLVREIPMLHDPKCTPPWSDAMPTRVADYLCAKAIDQSNDASPRTCHGDSGSGLQVRDANGRAVLLGITSFGSGMCPSNELARFTRTDKYLHKICDLIGLCYMIRK